MRRLAPVLVGLLSACSSTKDHPVPDASSPPVQDAAEVVDLGVVVVSDAGVLEDAALVEDAAVVEEDAGVRADGGTQPLPGFGAISGPCGVLDDELTSTAPAFLVNHLDFGTDGYDDEDYERLTEGGQEIIDDGNAGGSSIMSEVFAYEMLHRCDGALLLKTETEVEYLNPMGKITDLLVEIDGLKIGVSVTRAVIFPHDQPYPVERARELLEDKLQGIIDSTANVTPQDAWVKQFLYVLAYGDEHAESWRTAFSEVDPLLLEDTIVIVTVSDGEDAFIY